MARLCFIDWDHQRLTVLVAECTRNRFKAIDSWSETTELSPNPVMAEDLGQFLKNKLRDKKHTVTGLVALVGRDRLVVRDQKYPPVTPVEEPGLVRLLTTREILDDPNDVIIDYQPWAKGDSKEEQRALVYVLRREMLATYENMAKTAGLKLLGLCPRAMGLAAAMPEGAGTRGLIAVGSGWRELLVVSHGAVEMDRGLALGEMMAQEARRGFAVFSTTGGSTPGRIFATGATLQEVDQLGQTLELAIEDLEGLEGSPAATPGGASFTALFGIAKAWSRGQPGVDFVHPRMPKSEISDSHKRLYLYGGAAAALLMVLGVTFWWYSGNKEADLALTQAKIDELKKENARFVEDEKKMKELANWDTANWLEELVDLASRLKDPKKLLVTEIIATPQQQVAGTLSPYTGRLEIKGMLPDGTGDEKELEKLDKDLRSAGPEGFYLTKLKKTGKVFTLEVLVKARSPEDYTLVPLERKVDNKTPESKDKAGILQKDKGTVPKLDASAVKGKISAPVGSDKGNAGGTKENKGK